MERNCRPSITIVPERFSRCYIGTQYLTQVSLNYMLVYILRLVYTYLPNRRLVYIYSPNRKLVYIYQPAF